MIAFLMRQERSKEINSQDNSYQSDINKAAYNICYTPQSAADKESKAKGGFKRTPILGISTL